MLTKGVAENRCRSSTEKDVGVFKEMIHVPEQEWMKNA